MHLLNCIDAVFAGPPHLYLKYNSLSAAILDCLSLMRGKPYQVRMLCKYMTSAQYCSCGTG